MRVRQTRPSRLARPGQLPAAYRPTSAQSRQTNSEPWAPPLMAGNADSSRRKDNADRTSRSVLGGFRSVRGVRADFAVGATGPRVAARWSRVGGRLFS